MREKTSKRGMPRRAAGRSPGGAAEGRQPRRSRGALRAGAIPLQRPAEKKKPPPAASEKPFDRREKLR